MAVIPDRVVDLAVSACSVLVLDADADPSAREHASLFLEAIGRLPLVEAEQTEPFPVVE